jgi:hypothetical protein
MMYERTPKDSHLDTIYYEIDMLRYCIHAISQNAQASPAEANLLVEGALLHYRNLIRFFGGRKHRKGDLSTIAPEVWAVRAATSRALANMRKIGSAADKADFKEVSVYLQHITEHRAAREKQWDLLTMYSQLSPALDLFEECFPRQESGAPLASPG